MAEEQPVVPPVDAQPAAPDESNGRSDYEYRLLEADAKARENLNRVSAVSANGTDLRL